jgi:hypothetical protein
MMKAMKSKLRFAVPAALLAVLLVTGSCRRELWVYQDYFKNLLVVMDWRSYDRDAQLYPHSPDPEGMTLWFYPHDGRVSYRFTTTEVNHYPVYMSYGDYSILAIDNSPEEYNMQEFIGMDLASTAKVQATPYPYQGEVSDNAVLDETGLYSLDAYAHPLLRKQTNGLWTVAAIPEVMASDVEEVHVNSGSYANYIPYKERNTYQTTLEQQEVHMTPLLVPWRMRVRIPIKGIHYLREVSGSIAGMADGYYLVEEHTSDDPCIHTLKEDWQYYVTGDNEGYIAFTFRTWGMRNSLWSQYDDFSRPFRVDAAKDEVRLNLKVVLRDRKTVCYFHIDVGDQVWVYGNEYALSVDLRDVLKGDDIPELPYVDAANGIDFDGVVVPWEPVEEIDVQF